jgi:hypothetical protein
MASAAAGKNSSAPSNTAKAYPVAPARIAAMQSKEEQKRQDKALAELMKKRQAEAKRTGNWNNYGTN